MQMMLKKKIKKSFEVYVKNIKKFKTFQRFKWQLQKKLLPDTAPYQYKVVTFSTVINSPYKLFLLTM